VIGRMNRRALKLQAADWGMAVRWWWPAWLIRRRLVAFLRDGWRDRGPAAGVPPTRRWWPW
jgi:hypothetical protein